jgi:hypothetical protein
MQLKPECVLFVRKAAFAAVQMSEQTPALKLAAHARTAGRITPKTLQ